MKASPATLQTRHWTKAYAVAIGDGLSQIWKTKEAATIWAVVSWLLALFAPFSLLFDPALEWWEKGRPAEPLHALAGAFNAATIAGIWLLPDVPSPEDALRLIAVVWVVGGVFWFLALGALYLAGVVMVTTLWTWPARAIAWLRLRAGRA